MSESSRNELGGEKSPYLLQHKDNPVWWKSWSDKTIKNARERNSLIFLSIGYATCHWCHVMEHESFEDAQVANVLNAHFVSIKVDREELPDVDQIYMDAIHAMGQRGGWPLNLILTPDLRPIFGGTYFQKPHFMRLLLQLSELWTNDRDKMIASADQVFQFLNQQTRQYTAHQTVDPAIWSDVVQNLKNNFDTRFGGFGDAPKFPPNTQLNLVARLYKKTNDKDLLHILEKTLQEMARGGLYDHIGGGFTRYSVDAKWEIPHFEKMLYVNSQCIVNYLEAYQITQDISYLKVAEDTLNYVTRDMMSSGSGYYSAEDADSLTESQHKEEGAFYVWTYEELEKLLTPEELEFSKSYLGVTVTGNFENNTNHLHLNGSKFWDARDESVFTSLQKKLFQIREKRERPLLDDKQLTSWNALMITAFARAYRVTAKKEYLEAAIQSARFIKSTLYDGQKLFRRYREGQKDFNATLDDYSYLIQSLIELYQAAQDDSWLIWANELQEKQNLLFWDISSGGYFYTEANTKNLIVRTKDFGDNAMPNSNGIAAWNLVALSHYFANTDYRTKAERSLACIGEPLGKFPSAFCTALCTFDFLSNETSQQLAVARPLTASEQKDLASRYLPNLIIASGSDSEISLLKDKNPNEFYLCHNGACDLPVTDWQKVLQQLK